MKIFFGVVVAIGAFGFLFSGCVAERFSSQKPAIQPVAEPVIVETKQEAVKELPPVVEEKKMETVVPVETVKVEPEKLEETPVLETKAPEAPETKQEEPKAESSAESPQTGAISGTVTILGKDGEKQDAGHVLIALEPFDAGLIPPREPKVFKMDMENKVYVPSERVVRVGDQVVFDNLDSFRHNVFSLSEENKFDLGTYGSGERPGVAFQKPGVVKVYCNIHPDMAAFVLVSRSDWSAVTDESGNFKVEGLPAGEYVLKAWSVRAELEKQVVVKAGGAMDVAVELDASKYQPAKHTNKFGKEYPRNFSDDESY